MDTFVEIGDLPKLSAFLRGSIGGEAWEQWGRNYILRYRMKKWADEIGEENVLEALVAAAVCKEGSMSFWSGVEYTLRAKYPYGHEAHQRESPESDRAESGSESE